MATKLAARTFDTHKDDPDFALEILPCILTAANHPDHPGIADDRLRKVRYILRTLGLAAGISEARVEECLSSIDRYLDGTDDPEPTS